MDADAFIQELKKKIAAQDRLLERTQRALEQCDPELRIAIDLDELSPVSSVHAPPPPPSAIRA